MTPHDLLSPERLRGVLLDVDGTLADSNLAHARAWSAALRREGFEKTPGEVFPLIGMGGDKLVPELTGQGAESEVGQRLTDGWVQQFRELIPELRPTPGARALIEGLRARGLRVVLATSGEAEIVDALLGQIGLGDLDLERVSSSDVEHSKPDPDLVKAGLHTLGLPAGAALMVGDTPYDAEAARGAGVPCILLRCGGHPGVGGYGPLYDDPQALLAALDEAFPVR